MAFAPVILGVLGAIGSAAGAVMQGQAQASAAKYQAAIAENNAKIAQNNAAFERQKGSIDAQNQDLKNRSLFGQILAQQGASGLDVGSGSSVDTQASQKLLGRYDTLSVKNDSERRAVNFANQSQNFELEAQGDRASARWAESAGILGGFTSLIGGLSDTANKWDMYKMSGGTGIG